MPRCAQTPSPQQAEEPQAAEEEPEEPGLQEIVVVIEDEGKLGPSPPFLFAMMLQRLTGSGVTGISFDMWDEEVSEDLVIAAIAPGSLAAQQPSLTCALIQRSCCPMPRADCWRLAQGGPGADVRARARGDGRGRRRRAGHAARVGAAAAAGLRAAARLALLARVM